MKETGIDSAEKSILRGQKTLISGTEKVCIDMG
jgi:hypothetical protein